MKRLRIKEKLHIEGERYASALFVLKEKKGAYVSKLRKKYPKDSH